MTGAPFGILLFGAAIFLVVVLDSLSATMTGLEGERDDG